MSRLAPPGAGPATRAERPRRAPLWALVELGGLAGVAFAQPVLASFEESSETFVFRRASTTDVVLFAIAITLGPALVLWILESLATLIWPPAGPSLHLAFLVGLGGVLGWQLVERNTGWGTLAHVAAVVGAGALVGLGVALLAPARTALRCLAAWPVAVAALWLTTGPVSHLAFASGPGTVQGVPASDPAPVVMVTFDELPTASLLDGGGGIDASLWPNFARLASGATWFRNHAAVSPTTPEAAPTILTGRYPRELKLLPTSDEHPDNLFRALEGSYELNVWESTTQLCPPDRCPAQGGAVDVGLLPLLGDAAWLWWEYMDEPPPSDPEQFGIRQSEPMAPERFRRFIDSIEPTDGLRLDFIHTLFPHQPWRWLPSGARHDGPFIAEGLTGEHYSWSDEYFALAGRQRHLLQLAMADRLLGELLDRLSETDRYDSSLIVVTADHGASFTPGAPVRGISEQNEAEVMWVPLLIKEPDQTEGRVVDHPTSAVDVFPTIADLLGLDLSWELDGTSVFAPRDGEDLRRFYGWGLNALQPPAGEDYVLVDGEQAFGELLDREPVGSEPRDDLQLYRFGRWGHLVGREVGSLDVGSLPQLDPGAESVRLLDPDGRAVGRDRFTIEEGMEELPTYVRGELSLPAPAQVAVAVNGFVGGWGETFMDEGAVRFFVLVPQQLMAVGTNEIEVFALDGSPGAPVLRPMRVDWDG